MSEYYLISRESLEIKFDSPKFTDPPRNGDGLTEEQVEWLKEQSAKAVELGFDAASNGDHERLFPATFPDPKPEGKLSEEQVKALRWAYETINVPWNRGGGILKSAFPEAFDEAKNEMGNKPPDYGNINGIPRDEPKGDRWEWTGLFEIPKEGDGYMGIDGLPHVYNGEHLAKTYDRKRWILRRCE